MSAARTASGDTVTAAIETAGLTKRFGDLVAVDNVDLRVEPGTVFGFLGPNGAGKSTMMKLLLDALRPTAGSARVLGLDTHVDMTEVHRRCGYVPGELRLPPRLTGRQFLRFLSSLRGPPDDAVIADLIDRFDIDLDRKMHTLSTGNKRKIGLLQAFMHTPELVLLDEPTRGIDPLVQHEFQEYVREFVDTGGTAFLSSHTLAEVERIADTVGIIRDGRLIALDDIDRLRGHVDQHLDIEFTGPPDVTVVDTMRTLTGTRAVVVEANHLHVRFTGDLDPILRCAIGAGHVVRAASERADLEETFLHYYHVDGGAE